jgi:hypothetical protein
MQPKEPRQARRVVVCGARRRRQGIGDFILHWLTCHGAQVTGIVGSSEQTVRDACTHFLEQGIACRGYTRLEEAIASEKPGLVVIATPYSLHKEHLTIASDYARHCLCEKPLWWDNSGRYVSETSALVKRFSEQHLWLSPVTQWPYTLPTFYRLYPHLRQAAVEKFSMSLTPTSQGPEMVLDAAPHVISMLHQLVGCGEVHTPLCLYRKSDLSDMELSFTFRHRQGLTAVVCRFCNCDVRPRPAAYSINGSLAERIIALPGYEMQLKSASLAIPLEDPLSLLVSDVLSRLSLWEESGEGGFPGDVLVNGMAALGPLFEAAQLAVNGHPSAPILFADR